MAKNWIALVVLALLTFGCASRNSTVSRATYDDITIGTSYTDVERELGEPYNVQTIGHNTYEYEYVEKLSLNPGTLIENHYFIVVQNGKVVSKRMQQEKSPAYNQIYQIDPNYPNYLQYPQY